MYARLKGYLVKRPSILVAVLGLLALIVVCLTILIGFHRDTSGYVATVSPIIVTLLGLFVVSRQIDDVRDTAQEVKEQTNGKLDAKFSEIHDKLDEVADKVDEGNAS